MAQRILVVDDNRHIRMLAGAMLRSAGYEVLEAENGARGIERAVAEHPDLVLLDVVMPELDGFETLRFLKARPETRAIPVIMVTTEMTPESRKRGLDGGAEGYLGKPFKSAGLLVEIRRLLDETVT